MDEPNTKSDTGKKVLKKRKIKVFNQCKNHPDKRAIRFCEECDEPFCKECLTEYWSHNFIRYAYMGEQKDFSKEYLCQSCSRKKRRKGVLMSSSLLIILLIFIAFSIYNA